MKIIGISGTNGSGKDTIAHLLAEKYGFYAASVSDMFRAELIKRGLPLERENMRAISAEWRGDFGLGVVIDKAVAEAEAVGYDKLVVGSLRNPGEVERVHELGGIVIWVDADSRVRYDRIQAGQRGRVEDQKTFEQFLAEEEAEMYPSGDATTLNMAQVRDLSDRQLDNSTSDKNAFMHDAEIMLQDLL